MATPHCLLWEVSGELKHVNPRGLEARLLDWGKVLPVSFFAAGLFSLATTVAN